MNKTLFALILSLTAIAGTSASAAGEALLYESFDNYTGGKIDGWNKISGSTQFSVANFSDHHGNCLAIKSSQTSSPSARYRFDKTYTDENIYRISLYTRCDTPESAFVLSLLDEENNPYRTIKTGTDVQAYTGDGATSFTRMLCDEYKADSWYGFNIWFDMGRDKISYVMTDTYGGVYNYETDCSIIDEFSGINITQMGTENTVYVDDIKVEIATRDNIEKWIEEGVAVPDDIANEFAVTLSSDKLGNIFFDNEDALVWADIKSCDTKANTKTLHFALKDTGHRVVWSADEKITLGAGEETRITLMPKMQKYGTYLLEVTDGEELLCYTHMSRCVKNTQLNKRLGLSTHTTKTGADLKVLDLMQAAGFGFARENFRWNEDADGNILNTATALEPFMGRCIELGIEPYALMRIECSPKYDNPDGGFTTSDEALAGVEEYYRLIAEATKGKVNYFSAWCELYFIKELDGVTVGDGADYAKILKAAYRGLKAGNPDAKLIGFNDFIAKSVSRVTYRQALDAMKAEGKYYFDVFGAHPYHASQDPEVKERWDENNSWIDLDTHLDELIEEYGLSDYPRWANEVGYMSLEYDDERAAKRSIRMLLLNDALDSYDVMNIHDLQDMYIENDKYGLLRCWKTLDTPYSAKPQYIAFSWWNKLMNGAVLTNYQNVDDKYICRYTNEGRNITALWDVSDSRDTVEIPTNGNCVYVYDMYGNVIDTESTNDTITLEYTDKPIFIVENEPEPESEMTPLIKAVNIKDLWDSPLLYTAE